MAITIHATQERLDKDYLTIGEINRMQRGDLGAIISALAKFLIDEETGGYYPLIIYNVKTEIKDGAKVKVKEYVTEDEADDDTIFAPNPAAIARIENLRPKRIQELGKEFQTKLKDGAVPKGKGTASALP